MEDYGALRADGVAAELPDLLARHVNGAREYLGIDRVSILVLADTGALVLAASSLPPGSLEGAPRRIDVCFPPNGPLSECLVHAEERMAPAEEGTSSPEEAALLRSLGRSVLILPLVGRKAFRCWRELSCSRRDCPAYEAPETRCWLVSGTVCRNGQDREPREKLQWCLGCPAFGVVGVMAAGVADGPDASQQAGRVGASDSESGALMRRAERAKLCHLAASITATIEAAQSTRALLRLNAELERKVAEAVREREIAHQRASASEKLAATGKLVAGLAHQLNNPLGVIHICVQSLKAGMGEAAARSRNVEIIETEVRRLSRLVRSLLDFAHDRELRIAEVDLGELVDQSTSLARSPARRSGVTLHVAEADGYVASVDRALMQQVLVNLVMNAIQAAPRGGRVDVAVREGPAAGRAASGSSDEPTRRGDGSRTVDIVIKDNGPGMEPDVLACAFDPFFTTRSRSGGIGLGLSLAASIVERHGGSILVESAPGEGAAFTVRLPARRVGVSGGPDVPVPGGA
ncbi:MAG: sensor histidine kinase [Planctomycetota bacterium]